MEAFAKWAKTSIAKKAMEDAKSKACKNFLAKFPNADKSKFEVQVYFENEKDHTAKAEIYLKKGQGFLTNVFGSDSKYWSAEMKAALGKPSGFPQKLLPIGRSSLPIPAVSFDIAAPSLKKLFNNSINMYATPGPILNNEVQRDISNNQTHPPFGKRVKQKMAGSAQQELLAATAELRSLVRDNWLWNFA